MILSFLVGCTLVFHQETKVYAQEDFNIADYLNDVKIKSVNGELYKDAEIDLESDPKVVFEMDFSEAIDHQFMPEKSLVYQLPNEVVVENQSGNIMMGELSIGIYNILEGGKIVIDLDDRYDNDDSLVQNCQILFESTLKDVKQDALNPKKGIIHFDGGKDVSFNLMAPGNFTMSKVVTNYDATNHIATYAVNVEIPKPVYFKGGTTISLEDIMESNLTFVEDSLTLKIGNDVALNQENPVINNNQFTYQLVIAPNSTVQNYVLTYQAKIKETAFMGNDISQSSTGAIEVNKVSNTINATEPKSRQRTSTVDLANDAASKDDLKYQWIQKDGRILSDGKSVEWTVSLNDTMNFSIAGYTFKDEIGNGEVLTYDTDKLVKITKYNKDGMVSEATIAYDDLNVNTQKTSFTYQIPTTDTENYRYEVTYYTLYNKDKFIGTNNYYNDGYLIGPEGSGYQYRKRSGVLLGGVNASVEKKVMAYDFDTTQWQCKLNVPKEGLAKAYLEDIFSKINTTGSQELVKIDSINFTDGVTVNAKLEQTTSGFRYYFSGNIAEGSLNLDNSSLPAHTSNYSIIITYTTKIVPMEESFIGKKVENKAVFHVQDTQAEAKANRNIIKAVNKTGVVNTKSLNGNQTVNLDGTITWNIIIPKSYLKDVPLEAGSFILIDRFDTSKLSFIEDSVQLKKLTETPITDLSVNKFDSAPSINDLCDFEKQSDDSIKFSLDIDSDDGQYYRLTYKTKVIDENLLVTQGVLEYENSVELQTPDTGLAYQTSDVVAFENKLINKVETQKPTARNRYNAEFTIDVNPLGLDLSKVANAQSSNYVVYDQPSSTLMIDYDSIVIRDETSQLVVDKGNYQVVKEGSKLKFTIDNLAITGNADVGHNYTIHYQAKVLGTLGNEITYANGATLNGLDSIKSEHQSSVLYLDSSGSGTMLEYALTIKKQDDNNLLQGVPGATYAIYKDQYNPLNQDDYRLDVFTTNEEGYFTIERMLTHYGIQAGDKLIIVEIEAPAHYALDPTPHTIIMNDGSINGDADNQAIDFGSTYYVNEAVVTNQVVINKEFYMGNELVQNENLSAIFALYKENEEQPSYQATSFDHKATFNNIAEGNYLLKETATSKGYGIDPTTYKVVVKSNGIELFDLNNQPIENIYYRNQYCFGEFSFIKTNNDSSQLRPLTNATFVLKQDGEVRYSSDSDDNGLVNFSQLKQGQYILSETKAPSRYIASTVETMVTVDETGEVTFDDSTSDTSYLESIYRNELQVGQLAGIDLIIYLNSSQGEALFGAEFKLEKQINKVYTFVGKVKLNSTSITFNSLDVGSYRLTQTIVPDGYLGIEPIYLIIDENLNITLVTEGGQLIENELLIENTKIPEIIPPETILPPVNVLPPQLEQQVPVVSNKENEVVKTGDNSNILGWGLCMLLASVSGMMLNKKNRKEAK